MPSPCLAANRSQRVSSLNTATASTAYFWAIGVERASAPAREPLGGTYWGRANRPCAMQGALPSGKALFAQSQKPLSVLRPLPLGPRARNWAIASGVIRVCFSAERHTRTPSPNPPTRFRWPCPGDRARVCDLGHTNASDCWLAERPQCAGPCRARKAGLKTPIKPCLRVTGPSWHQTTTPPKPDSQNESNVTAGSAGALNTQPVSYFLTSWTST